MIVDTGRSRGGLHMSHTDFEAALDAARADGRREGIEEAAHMASMAHLVEPDGGGPSEEERLIAETAARRIRSLLDAPPAAPSEAQIEAAEAAVQRGAALRRPFRETARDALIAAGRAAP